MALFFSRLYKRTGEILSSSYVSYILEQKYLKNSTDVHYISVKSRIKDTIKHGTLATVFIRNETFPLVI